MRLERRFARSLCGTLAACAWLTAGCAGPDEGRVPLRMGSVEAFARDVQPHVAERCAQGGCHGRPDRPLSLYAPGMHRADPERLYLDEPLTREELAENARRVAAFAQTARVEQALVLRKPLAPHAGGCWHGGGTVFVDASEPAYRAIRDWLAEAIESSDGGTW